MERGFPEVKARLPGWEPLSRAASRLRQARVVRSGAPGVHDSAAGLGLTLS